MIHFNYNSNKMTDVIILGVPDHLNQIGRSRIKIVTLHKLLKITDIDIL